MERGRASAAMPSRYWISAPRVRDRNFPAQNGKVFRVEYFYFSAYYGAHFWVISENFSPGASVEFYPISFFFNFVGVS